MCGITGILDKGNKQEIIRAMTDAIVHRGPDDDGYYIDEHIALGMRRLSIIDLEGGKQPIYSQDENFVIVFNGEIYNYQALRKDLIARGYKFNTLSDTEVVLHLFEAEGSKCLDKLRGMFAFAILDKRAQKLFIARDFFGIKPLYYFLNKNGYLGAFGSEIKSILAIPNIPRVVNDEAVFNYLSFQYNPLKETFFKGIFKLTPGSFLDVDLASGEFVEKKYDEFSFDTENEGDEKTCAEELLAVLDDSVKHHLVSDVPVGSFLSGGIDSGIIAALAQKNLGNRPLPQITPSSRFHISAIFRFFSIENYSSYFNTIRNFLNRKNEILQKSETESEEVICGRGLRKLSTFTIGFDEVSEAREAEVTARHIGTDHTAITIARDEYFKELPNIVWYFDEPVADPSAAALYFVAREARKKVKVVMSGEGADELFGGYNIYLESYARRRLTFVPKIIREKILRPLAESKYSFRGKNFLIRFFGHLEDWYIGNANIFSPREVESMWKGDQFSQMSLAPLYEKVSDREDSEKMQYIDINTWLSGDILAKADKMTMAHSLELRVPFLDREVFNFARRLPPKLKWKNYTTKYLLRAVADTLLTPAIARRKKLGFPTPVGKWFDASQGDIYRHILENTYIREHFNIPVIQKLIDDHISGRKDNARKIYLFLLLALWHDIFIGKIMKVKK